MDLNEFFGLVLPRQGFKAVAWRDCDGFQHHVAESDRELADKALSISGKGKDVYCACASFKQRSYVAQGGSKKFRTRQNASFARALWLDIDVGKPECYSDLRTAIPALARFCDHYKLPLPMPVFSGAGLHCYWPFQEDVAKDEWLPIASKLKALTKHPEHPLLVDHSRTSDIASILRPVETRNFKRDPNGEPVRVLKPIKPVCFEDFRMAIDVAYASIAATIVRPKIGPRELTGNQAEIAEVEGALHHIDPDRGDRSDWWTIVAAIADEFGEAGREVARRWSRGDL